MMFYKFTIICILYLFIEHSDTRILNGQLITRDNWAFLARFCFLTEKGIFEYRFVINGVNSTMNLLLYYDSLHQWPSVYPSSKSCQEKESILSWENGQIVPMSSFSSDCKKKNGTLECISYRRFKSARPRWWFIALSDCFSKTGLNVTYLISLTNAPDGSFWRQHFSADEFYILPELITAICIYILLIILSCYVAVKLCLRRLLHFSYIIFMGSMILQLIGISLETHSYMKLGKTGIHATDIYLFGIIFEMCSDVMYTELMLLLACGYTVTKSVLPWRQATWLLSFIFFSSISQLILLRSYLATADPGLVLYIYESPQGYGLIALKLAAWIIFVFRCSKTVRKKTAKARFYAALLSLGSIWFLFHPLMVLAITFLVEKWIRESIVKGCSILIIFLGHATFLYVTRPTSANEHFPFHIRTCQVNPIGGEGQDHGYEPHAQTSSAFIISHTSSSLTPPAY